MPKEKYIRKCDTAEVDEFLSLRLEEYNMVSNSKNSVIKFSDICTDQ